MIEAIESIARSHPSEQKQKQAVARHLGSLPEVVATRSPDGTPCRIYVWRDRRVALVAGRGLEPLVYALEPHQPGEPVGAVYLPARGRHPALTAAKPGSPRRENPSVKGGRVRKDEIGEFVEWRPRLPSSGKRPRIRLYGDDPVMEAIDDAQDAINARIASVDREYGGTARKPRRRATLRAPKEATVKTTPAAPVVGPLYDSQGREYEVTYRVVTTPIDPAEGEPGVLPSNSPRTMRARRDYPAEFQARILDSPAETAKINEIARSLQPGRVLARNADPTIGPPVVWSGPDTPAGVSYVLGGNGRTIALLRAPAERYAAYQDKARELYPGLWPSRTDKEGERTILVRDVRQVGGAPLSFQGAVALAAASQASTSAAESPLGEALSLARSIGVTDSSVLPPFAWDSILDQGNVADFVTQNPAFTEAVLDRLDPAQKARTRGDDQLTAEILNAVMAAALPDSIRVGGFAGPKEERALMALLPVLLTLQSEIRSGAVPGKWGLISELDAARAFSRQVKRKSLNEIIAEVERNASQEAIAGTKTIFDDLGPKAVMLAVVLQRAANTRDPALTIRRYLTPYLQKAREDQGSGAAQGGFSFGTQYQSSPAEEISRIAGFNLPTRYRRTNPPRGGGGGSQVGLFGGADLDLLNTLTVQHFASGSNHPGEIRGFARIGKPVGVAVSVISKTKGGPVWRLMCDRKCQDALIEAVTEEGVPIFIDSGAFSEVGFDDSTGPYTVAPIEHDEWLKRLNVYRAIIEGVGPERAALVNVVAPDKIADQEETLRRLRRYAPIVRNLIDAGASVLVPLQKGAISLADFHRAAEDAIGVQSYRWVPAIPMKKDATTPADLEEYLREIRPRRVHLLGVGPGGQKASEIARAVLRGSPATQVQSDSVVIRADVGRKGGARSEPIRGYGGLTWAEMTDTERRQLLRDDPQEAAILQAEGELPKRLTRAQDIEREIVGTFRYSGGDLRDSEGITLPDYTDMIGDPTAWLTKSRRKASADALGLEGALRRQWMADPTAAAQTEDEDGERLADRYDYDEVLDGEWVSYIEGLETAAVKERAIVAVYGRPEPLATVPFSTDKRRRANPDPVDQIMAEYHRLRLDGYSFTEALAALGLEGDQ